MKPMVPIAGLAALAVLGAGCTNDYAYDPDKAKALLAEAGWDAGQVIRLNTYYSDASATNILAAIQQVMEERKEAQ